jgi:hypothetical protein
MVALATQYKDFFKRSKKLFTGIVLLCNLLPKKIVCGRHNTCRPFLSITAKVSP